MPKKFVPKDVYSAGDVCWNCGKVMRDPRKHYPINSTIFCKPDPKKRRGRS